MTNVHIVHVWVNSGWQQVKVRVEVDTFAIAKKLAAKAHASKSKRSRYLSGNVVVTEIV